ncbi:MAG: YgiQ family radical SAM protein, partial [Clostridia bacterium]|nr:YgiQ family radical SAM protein [Clostridia bacterium]
VQIFKMSTYFQPPGNSGSYSARRLLFQQKKDTGKVLTQSPGGKMGLRPDRATIVYSKKIREAYPDTSIILGGLEASLRRFGHYDYWDDTVMKSVLVESGADILTYGMGENILRRIAELLDKGVPINKIRDVRGTVWLGEKQDKIHFEVGGSWDFESVKNNKREYAKTFALQYKNQDSISGKALVEYYGDKMLVQNPPMAPLTREELDEVYALPYMRDYHFSYKKQGGVPAIEEVKFSLTHNRGCFGGCNFCALAFHQGRSVRSRSIESVVEEAKLLTTFDDFKGYINDVGGPTANFREPACDKQLKSGVCTEKKCLAPTPCKNLKADHSEYIELLSQIERLPKVKKVFIRSGIRFDYLLCDKSPSGNAFFKKLVKDHVSGQLKVAPEHCSESVLKLMGKPEFSVYEKFRNRYFELTKSFNKEQYLVPYLMSSHPGSKLQDAIKLSEFIRKWNYNPEQVQDFYPTPGTASTVMFYTGLDPFTLNEVYVPRSSEEKRMQRALLQCRDPKNADLVRKALKMAHREDLIVNSKNCLVAPSYKDRV